MIRREIQELVSSIFLPLQEGGGNICVDSADTVAYKQLCGSRVSRDHALLIQLTKCHEESMLLPKLPCRLLWILGGLDAKKQLEKTIFCHFLKNPRWAIFFSLHVPFIQHSLASNGIIYLGSFLSVSCARAPDKQTHKYSHRIAYYCPGPASSWAGRKNWKVWKITPPPRSFCWFLLQKPPEMLQMAQTIFYIYWRMIFVSGGYNRYPLYIN